MRNLGNGGIGLELCNQLLAKGEYHVLLASRSLDKGNEAVKQLQSRGLQGTVEVLELDVTDDENIDAAVKKVEAAHGKLDILVNNAGIAGSEAPLRKSMLAAFNANAVGPAVVTEAFAPLLKRSTAWPARVVNVGTGGGSITMRLDPNAPGSHIKHVPYRTSKAALNMVTACQVVEFAQDDIKVFLYAPGFTVSNLGPRNNVASGAKPTAEAVWPLVEIIEGRRDREEGQYLHSESFDNAGSGVYPW